MESTRDNGTVSESRMISLGGFQTDQRVTLSAISNDFFSSFFNSIRSRLSTYQVLSQVLLLKPLLSEVEKYTVNR